MNDYNNITFKELEKEDLLLLHKWLQEEHVAKWYGKERDYSDMKEVEKRYIPFITKEMPTYSFIINYNNIPIGYIQTYLISDYPEYANEIIVDDNAAGLDLFIGEANYIHKGLGKFIITKFLNEYVFSLNNTNCCVIGPEPNNKGAIKAYEKAGFKYFKTVQVNGEEEPEYLMRCYQSNI